MRYLCGRSTRAALGNGRVAPVSPLPDSTRDPTAINAHYALPGDTISIATTAAS